MGEKSPRKRETKKKKADKKTAAPLSSIVTAAPVTPQIQSVTKEKSN